MSFQSRSEYELGDPVYAELAAETARDHAAARERGERLVRLTTAVVDALVGDGLVATGDDARVVIFSVLATGLYGNAAIDVPRLRPACDHKFVDSPHCLKCGWVPPAQSDSGSQSV